MKIQYNKTKTIILSLTMGLVLMSPSVILPNVGAVGEIQQAPQLLDKLEKNSPNPLSDVDLVKLKHISINDAKVQGIIHGRPYSWMSTDYIGNLTATPPVWYPEIHINVGNTTQITVTTDLVSGSVQKVGVYPLVRSYGAIGPASLQQGSNTGAAVALDKYTGTDTTPRALYMTATAPGFSSNGVNISSFFLVNGLEYGADYTQACTPSSYYNNYFAQAGFWFGQTSASVTYMDTTTQSGGNGCWAQQTNLIYRPGDSYVFYIIGKSTNNWYIYGIDSTNGGNALMYTGPVVHYNTMFQYYDTSVWFENHNTSGNSGWYGQFTSDPAATALYADNSLTWHNWESSIKNDITCAGSILTDSVGVMYPTNTDLSNGNTLHWSMSKMAQNYNC